MNKKLLFSLFCGVFGFCNAVIGQLSGSYAIGPSGSYGGYAATYASITAANTALAASGVSGAVVFELQSDYG